MRSLEEYIYQFTHLRRASNWGGAPHKPILLLSILDAVERGYIKNEYIYITPELIALFKSNWSIWVTTPHNMNFALPFYHLSGEPFWTLIPKEGETISLTSKKSIKSFQALISSVHYAVMDKGLFQCMTNEKERVLLRQAITQSYFADITPFGKSDLRYRDEIAQQILHDSEKKYKRRIQQLEEKDTEEKEEEIFVRSEVFKSKIPEIYNYTCSITGLKILPFNNRTMIDACHIIPFHIEQDDTIGNGLALCPNLHRAFDNGLITIDENYKIVVSHQFIENSENPYSIRQFDNKELLLPPHRLFYPRKEALQWHNEHVFEKV